MRRPAPLLVALLLAGAMAVAPARPASAVVGGEEAEPGEWPWQVALLVDGELYCGGSLVAPDLVITAAHCTAGVEPGEYEILAGTISLDEGGQRRGVMAIDQHEGYDDFDLENDISLLTLEGPFELGPGLALVAVADAEQTAARAEEGDPAVVTGFGATSEEEPSSDVLLEAEIRTVADQRCATLYRENGDRIFGDTQVCAGIDRGRVDACYGDSGGPLVVPADDERTGWLLIGVVSYGAGCGQPRRPTVYTEVSAFAGWLGARGLGIEGAERYEGAGTRIPARGTRGKAARYPLTIEVGGFEGDVEDVSVRLLGLSHDNPEDLDIWLEAPDGTVVTLLSDVGGDDELHDASVLVVEAATPAGGFDLAAQIGPTDREDDDQRKGAVPPADLGALEGVPGDGEWRLLIADDEPGHRGRLGGWTLQLH